MKIINIQVSETRNGTIANAQKSISMKEFDAWGLETTKTMLFQAVCDLINRVDDEFAKKELVFVNGKPADCGCKVAFQSGGGQYADVTRITLCSKHAAK